MNETKSPAAPANVVALPTGFARLAAQLQKARSLKGRVEASHRKGEVKRSTASSLTLADGQKRSPEERQAYALLAAYALVNALSEGALSEQVEPAAKVADSATPTTKTA